MQRVPTTRTGRPIAWSLTSSIATIDATADAAATPPNSAPAPSDRTTCATYTQPLSHQRRVGPPNDGADKLAK